MRGTVLKAHKTEVWNDGAWEEVDTNVSAEDRARTSTIWCESCNHSWSRPSDDGQPTRRRESSTVTDPEALR